MQPSVRVKDALADTWAKLELQLRECQRVVDSQRRTEKFVQDRLKSREAEKEKSVRRRVKVYLNFFLLHLSLSHDCF